MIRRLTIGLVFTPFILVLVITWLSLEVDLAIDMTPVELRVFRYRSDSILERTRIHLRPELSIPSSIRGPIRAGTRGTGEGRKKGSSAGFVLSFILVGEDDRRAVINGRIVREGDVVNGARVAEIRRDGVALRINGILQWIKMEEQ